MTDLIFKILFTTFSTFLFFLIGFEKGKEHAKNLIDLGYSL